MREGGTVVDGHRLVEDNLRELLVASLQSLIVDVVGIASTRFLEGDGSALGEDPVRGSPHRCHDTLDLVEVSSGGGCRVGHAHGHAEYLAEGIPIGSHILLRNIVGSALEQEA